MSHTRVLGQRTVGLCGPDAAPLSDDVTAVAADLVSMVDGFATPGPRHFRARAARGRREAWLAELVTQVRAGTLTVPADSALAVMSGHREVDGEQLSPRLAAVELLNVIRPTVAVHRCPGEPATVSVQRTLVTRLANLDYDVPDQDMTISLRRIPARPRSGFVLVLRPAEG